MVCSILPKPTIGVTMPPLAKQMAPKRADALPALFRSLLSASVVDAVRVRPIKPKSGLITHS